MDDYNINTIIESKNEWCARLTNILTPCMIEGIKSIFDEAYNLCLENEEESKYLMTFQNLLNNIPKWTSEIIEIEKDRIIASSGCNYLEDLITCVHITQLKSLTVTRVGLKQKKVNIDIPNLNSFIHKAYIAIARKVYVNVYLFEKDILPLQIQKNNRELEIIVKECILNSIRENIPIENILKIYLDETQETDVEIEETREQILDEEAIKKMEKEKKEKELAAIKAEVEEKLRKESKESVKKAISQANKSLNKEASIMKDVTDLNEDSGTESEYLTEDESLPNSSSEKLVIGEPISNKKDKSSDLDLGIKSLDEDPDKLDLDVLDLDTEKLDDNIQLDIEELKL
jgi:hypothetical protein